jgi:hypothetical protein
MITLPMITRTQQKVPGHAAKKEKGPPEQARASNNIKN